ncbi:hypothetical protein D3C81_1055540 [compost metagenome]
MMLPPGRRLVRRVMPRTERATLPRSSVAVRADNAAGSGRTLATAALGALGASTAGAGRTTAPCRPARRRSRRRLLRPPLAGPAGPLSATLLPIPPKASALTTNTRWVSLAAAPGSSAWPGAVEPGENTLPSSPKPVSTTLLPVLGSLIGARSALPPRPASPSRPRPMAMLNTPRPTRSALRALRNAITAAVMPPIPIAIDGN